MNTPSARRFFVIRAVAFGALLCSTASVAAPSDRAVEVLGSRSPPAPANLPDRARAGSALLGVLDGRALSAPAIELTLADGQRIRAHLERIARDDAKNAQSWIGTFEDSPGSLMVLSKVKGVVTGHGNYKDQTLELLPAAGGKHLLFAVDHERLPKGDQVVKSVVGTAGYAADASSDYGTGGSTTAAANAVVHDVLVVYTAASATKWGASTLQSMINGAIAAANQAYINSYANITVNLVGLQQVSMSESGGGMITTMDTLEKNAEVQDLRKKLAADMVVLVSQDSNYCGYAKLTQYFTNGVTTWWDANSIVNSGCLSNQTVAHELGHLQGLDHNREDTARSGWYAYSYGHRACATDGFRDIMSYPCSSVSVPIINVFSNPAVTYNGYPTGISYEADPSRSAENARTLNNTAATVASYMTSSSQAALPPASPSGLAVSGSTYNSVSLGWLDNSTNETGFTVERSPDGVTFTQIASLGAGSRSFTDVSVGASSRYYYRVRAYNSYGASGYSNTVNVTTSSAPVSVPAPVAPSSVAASNQGNGSALVSWASSATNAATFEVRRETWDARKKSWGRATTAATVPSSVYSIVDATKSGTYRYFVRSLNSGGASAYAGPAQVTITGGTTAKSGKR